MNLKEFFEAECTPKTSVPYFIGTFETTLDCDDTGDGFELSFQWPRNKNGHFGRVAVDYGGFGFSFDTTFWDFSEMDRAITMKKAKEVTEDE